MVMFGIFLLKMEANLNLLPAKKRLQVNVLLIVSLINRQITLALELTSKN